MWGRLHRPSLALKREGRATSQGMQRPTRNEKRQGKTFVPRASRNECGLLAP